MDKSMNVDTRYNMLKKDNFWLITVIVRNVFFYLNNYPNY